MIKKQYLIIKPILLMMSHLHKTNFKGFSTHKKTDAGPLSILTETGRKNQGILLILLTFLLRLFSTVQLYAQASGRVFRGLGRNRNAILMSGYKAFATLCLVLSTLTMQAQRACNSTAITVSTLDFQNPTFVSGSNNSSFDVGDVYRFPNVTTGVDALVSINTLTGGATLPNFDIPAVTEGVDGYDAAFQPTLRTNGGNPTSANFTFNFVVAGGTLANPVGLNFYASALDIDGNGGTIREYDEFTLPDYYIRNNPSSITFSSTASLLRGEATTSAVQSGTSTTPANAFTVYYENRTSFNYTVGTLGAGASADRLKALYFQNITYTTPVTDVLTGPLVCGNVSSTSGSGVSGVTINLTGAVNQTTTTDASGNYSFVIAPANIGSYVITEVNLPKYVSISDVDGANDNIINVMVNFQSIDDRNFVDELDSDGDGITDIIDIDDDNDGILDKDEETCSLSGTWTQLSAGVWESPLASGYKTRVTLGNYNQFWDGALLPANVTNFNRSCTGITSDFGNIINTSKPALQVTAGNASGSATNASFTVEFLNASNAPVFVQDPKFHLAGLGGSDGNFVTSSKWTLQSGNFDMLSSNGRITVNSNTFVHNNLTNNNGSPMGNCASGEAAATFKVIGNRSSFIFDVQMLNRFGNPGNSNVALDQVQIVFEDCIVLDTDNDGIANHLDNDSDGDNCSDAREAGATLNKTANYAFAGPYGANGLADAKETVVDNGVINYALTYADATNNAINTCNIVPIPVADAYTGFSNQPLVLAVVGNDNFGLNGPNSSPITITQAAVYGTATVNNNGTPTNPLDDFINYSPNTGFAGQDSIRYSICDLDGDCATAIAVITVESLCDNILSNGGFESVPNSFTFPTMFEGVPSRGIAGNAPDSRVSNNWIAATDVGTRKAWLLNDNANVVNNPEGNKFVYFKGQYDCAQFCNYGQPNCNWAGLLGEPLINGMTYEISFYVAAWNETITSAGAGVPTGAGVQGATSVVVDFDMTTGPQLQGTPMAVPASSSFNTLNWVRKTYTFTYNAANPIITMYISQDGTGGMFLDDVKIRKTFSTGPDQLLCNVTNTTLAANPNVTAGTWISASGNPAGATFVAPTAGTTVVNGLVPGTYNFVKDINGCTDTVKVVNNAPASAGVGSATTVNINSVTTIGLDGLLTGEDAGGTWTRLTGTGGTFDNLLGTFIPTNATNSTFRYTKTGTAPCPTATADVTVNINNLPVANDDIVSTPLIENGANGTVNIITNDTDPNGNPTIPTNGAGQFVVDMNPTWPGIEAAYTNAAGVWTYDKTTGIVTFDPALNFSGVATMQYELCDPLGACDQASITFTVAADTDGDGIINDIDIDDDNDGILDTVECGLCASNPFANGGFELPDITLSPYSSTTYIKTNQNNTSGWQTNAPDGLIEIWRSGFNVGFGPVPSAEGNQFVELNANYASTLYQTFCLNGASGTVVWSVKHRGRTGTDVARLKMGATLASATLVQTMSDGNSAWGAYSGTYTIPAGQTNLFIAFEAVSSANGDATTGNLIDDVKITITQGCPDTDGDGIVNSLDLDSDGDGCSDAFEAGATTNLTANYAFTGAVGTNGLDNSKETAVDNGIINYTSTYNKAINNAIKACIPSAPVATNDNVTTLEDTPLSNSVATNATDVDGNLNPNSFVTTDGPLHGSITLNTDGTYLYTPNLNFNGVDSVHYKVCDLGTPSLCDTATIIITITAVNDAPIASNVPVTTPKNTPLISTVVGSATDVDNNINPLGYTKTDNPVHGTIVINPNGTFTYTPTMNFVGIDSVHYQVCDLGTPVLCATATLVINVTPVIDTDNDGIADNIDIDDDNDGILDTAEGYCQLNFNESFDSPVEININDNNIKGNTYNSLVTQNGASFNIIRVDGTGYGFGPDNAQNGNQYLDIASADDYPLYAFTLTEPGIVNFSAYFSNRDRSSFGYRSWTGQVEILNSTKTTVLASGNALLFDNTISDELWFLSQANNISLPAGSYYFRSFVGNWGHLDNMSICSSRDTDGDGVANYVDLDSDNDGCSDAYEAGATTNLTANYAFTGAVGANGLADTKETAVDNGIINYALTYNKATNNAIKACIPSAPVATNDNVTTLEDTPLSNSVATNATDVDGNLNPNSFVTTDSPLHGTITLNTDGTYLYTPNLNFNGVDSVHYKVCDLGTPSLCGTATIIVTVTAVNDAPIAGNKTVITPESTSLNGTAAALASDVDGNLNPNSFTLVTPANHGNFTMNPDGTYMYLPTTNYTGVDSITYKVCDLGTPALCANGVIKINVTPICIGNAFLNNDFETVVNGTTFPFAGGTAGVQDAAGNSVTNWTKETVTTLGNNYKINSSAALSGANYMYIYSKSTAGTNDACVAQMNVPLNKKTTYEFCVHAADAKADGLPSQLALEIQEMKADGSNSVTFHTKTIVLPNNPNWSNTALTTIPWTQQCYSFTTNKYTTQAKIWISAASINGTDTSFVVIDDACIHPQNTAPIAAVDNISTNEDTPLSNSVATNDLDPDGNINPNSFVKLDAPTHGTIVFNPNGSYTYTPTSNFNGVDSIHYQVCDLGTPSLCDTASLVITINSVNDAPIASNKPVTTPEDVPLTSTVVGSSTDVDNNINPNGYTVTDAPVHGTIVMNPNGTFTYTPTTNFNGIDSVHYQVCDLGTPVLCSTATLVITVSPVNDKPVAGDDFTLTPQGMPVSGVVTANDSDIDNNLDVNSYVALDAPTHGTIVFNPNGSYTYTPNPTFSGTDSLHYKVCDLGTPSLCDTATIFLNVDFVNHNPVAINDTITTPEDMTIVNSVATNVTDFDNNLNPTSFVTTDAPLHGSIVLNNDGSYTYTPTLNFNGVDSVHYKVCDYLGLCDTATIIVTVSSVNDAPIASNVPVTTPEDAPLISTVVGSSTDVDNNINPNGYTTTDLPKHGTIVMNPNGTFTYTPTANFNGIDSVHYQVCDLGTPILCSTATLVITITPVNDLPIANVDIRTILEDAPATTVVVLTNDNFGGDGASLTPVTITAAPKHGIASVNNNGTPLNPTDDTVIYTPTANFNGKDTLIYRIEDANGDFDTAFVIFNITPVNDKPLANVDGITMLEDDPATTIDVLINDDFGGDGPIPSSITIIKQPVNGTASVNNNGTANNPTDDKIIYTPDPNYNGKDSLIYRIGDANGDYDTAIVYINITPVNDLPTANTEGVTVLEDAATTSIDVLLNDDFGGDSPSATSITIIKAPVNGTASVNDATTPTDPTDDAINYTPNFNFNGTDSLIYRICDANGDCDTAIVFIIVSSVNDKPIAGDDYIATPQATDYTGVVTANDTDVDNNLDPNSYVALDAPTKGTIVFNPNGSYTYSPNPTFSGTDSIHYRVCDLGTPTLCDTATIYFNVNFVNHNPIATNDVVTTPEDIVLVNSVATNVTDEDTNFNPTSFVTIDAPLHGTIVLNPNGSYTYTPNANYNGVDSVHYRVCDYLGLCDTATILITVSSVNDAPIASNVPVTTPEDMPLTSTVVGSSTDVDNNINPNGYTVTDAPVHGTIVMNPNGTFTYTPTANFNGIDSVHYQVCDLGTPILCSTATLVITVTSVNDLPLANTEGVTILEDAPATTINVLLNDTFGGDGANNAAITITDAPSNGTATVDNNGTPTDPTDDKVIYTPNLNFNGRDTLIYRIEDANGDFDTAIVIIRITPVNDIPTAVRDIVSMNEDATLTGTVATNDFDVDGNLNPNSFTQTSLPTRGTITFNPNGTYTYKPTVGYFGTDSVEYQVCDLSGLCDKEWLVITINHVNHAPVATNDVIPATEDTPVTNSVATNAMDVDGDLDPNSFATTDAPLHGTIVLNPNGTYTYTPTANFNGVDSVHYKVCDLSTPSLCDTATIIITVSSVNDAPIASNVPVTTPEDVPLTSTVVGSSTDVDNNINPNGYTVTDAPVHGTIVMNPNGTFTYTPTANFNGIDSVHYQVCDLGTPILCSTATLVITVTSVNDLPLANTEGVTISEDAPATTINVLTNDTFGGDGASTKAVILTKTPSNGVASINDNGTPNDPTDDKVIYTPNANYNGNDTLIYRIEDANGDFDTAVVYINITPVNDIPTAVRDIVSTNEDVTLTGTVATNDFDVDGNLNPNSFTLTTLPKHGTITINPNGSYTYNPTIGYFGTDSVEYQVCDLSGLCDKEWLVITINHVNHAPVATNDVVNATEDTPLTNSVATNATDVDSDLDPNSFATTDAPKHGTIVMNPNGTYTYTPNANFNGVDSVHYKVCDLSTPSLCDTATIIITVLPVNDAPVATNDVVSTPEDAPLTNSVATNATDVDGNLDPNSFITTDLPKHGTIVMNPNGSYTYTPTANFNGQDSVHYQVCDLGTPKLCTTATIVITISPVNDAPVTTNDVVTTPEDLPITDSVASNPSDVDNNIDPNSFVTIDAPTKGTIVMNPNGSYTYTPNANFNGVDSVHYQVCDLSTPKLCATATILITVSPVNDAPVAAQDNFTTLEEVQVSGTVTLNDSDIDNNINPNSFAQVDAPKHGTLVLDPNGNFTYNPTLNFFGIDTMSYRVCDLGTPILCDTGLLIINVSNVNDAPKANVDEGTVLVNGSTNVVILSNDTDADGVLTNVNTTITIDDAPNHGVASVNPDGTILYTPTANYVGLDTLIYKLCDNGTPQLCDTAIVFITVSATNNAPVANVDGISVSEDTSGVNIPVLTNDVDDQILTASNVSITDVPKHGVAVINPNGTIGYKPNANYNGLDTLIYRVCDNGTPALCDTAIVFITVTPVNDAPVAVNDAISGPEDVVVTGTVATNDTDIDGNLNPTSFVTTDMPTHGTIVMNPNGSYTYTPSNNFNGVDSVHYKVCDIQNVCATATLIITITPVNDKPLALDDVNATNMDSPVGGTVATNDFDIDGNLNPNSFVKIGDVLHGTITINPTGSYNYIPTIGFVGKDSVQYQVCDLAGSCDTAWLVITVTPISAVNKAPVATEELVLTNVNTPVNGTLTSKVSDPDGNLDNNSFAVVGTPKNGTITISSTGSYIYTPNANFVGEDSVQYRICDLGTPKLCDTSWILIVVNQSNRAPIALNDNVTTAMNNTYTGTLTTKVSDPDGNLNPNSFTQIGNATHGSMTINPNGSYSFIPTIGFVGKDSVQYQVCDLGTPKLCDTAWIVITILDAKPIAIDDAYTTDKNTTVGFKVTTNDDAKGTITTVNVITAPKNGSLNFVGIDSIRFTPLNGYCGKDTFTYSLCNQFGLCDTAQVIVTMNCVALPIAPVALDDIASTNKNTPVQIAMLDNDTTNGTLTKIEVITNPTRGTAVVQGNNILYTPATDSCGKNDTLTYRICTVNGCDTAKIVVSVNCGTVNNNANKPVAVDDAYTTDKGVSVTFKATLNDTLNGTLTGMNVIVDPRHGSILFRSPDTLIYTPQLGYCGKDTLTYVILNNKGLSDTADIVITITCTPDVATALPVAVKDVATTPKNKPVTVAVLTNDTLNGTLTKPIIIKTQPKRGTATVVNNDIVYTPQNGQCGYVDTVVYEICNIQGCSTAQVIVSVACPSTLPIAIDDNYVTDLNTSIKFSPLKNDTVNGVLKSLNIIATAKHGTVGAIGTDSLTYNPATGYCGKDTIQYSITRDDNEVDTAFIYVTINCGAKPDAINDVATTVTNAPKSINVLGNDATNGLLTKPVTVIKQPKQGTFTVDASNNIIYTPNKDACGFKDTLTYEICTVAGCDTAEVVVTVDCIAKPDARDDVATTKKNLAVDIDILNNDAINGILDSFKVVTQPTLGTATIVGGKLRYVPKADTCNYNDTLTYKICNPNACDTATVIVTVTCDTIVKVAPVANVDFGKTPKSTPIAINVLANDSLYSQVLDSIKITQQPKNGSVVFTTTNEVLYTPNATFCGGNDTLIYKICTAAGCDTALVVINVACDTPTVLPVANVDIDSTLRGKEIAIDVTLNDTLNGATKPRVISAPKHGTASIDVDDFLIYQPDSIFCGGTDSLIYEICSLKGCDTALVLIHVKCDSIGLLSPIAFDDSSTTQIDSAIVITILDNDILKGGTLQDSLVSKPRHGSVIFNNGAAFYMPNPGYWGLDTFEYAICNINGCDTARVIIKIDPGSNLTIFNGFSPDGDGMNDYFYIRGIENYPNNDVILWNRWGNQVGSIKGYNNADKAWDGTWNGKNVPDGTYFYIINFNDGVTKPVAGYVQIHR
jgi:large repetitive protein